MTFREEDHPRDENGRFTDGKAESSAARLKRVWEKHFPHLTEGKKRGKLSSENRKTVRLSMAEYAHVMSEIATNINAEQKKKRVFKKAIGDYVYTVENNEFGNWRIVGKVPIDSD